MSFPSVDTIAVRLADEGVPLRAIARATNIPSDAVRSRLHEALSNGTLVDLPKEDWPPGFPRDQRALQLSRLVTQNPEEVNLALQRVFSLTTTETTLLMLLVQNTTVPKNRPGMQHKTVDVHICHIRRRLKPFRIFISTLWGYGYQLSIDNRRRIMDLVLAQVEVAPA